MSGATAGAVAAAAAAARMRQEEEEMTQYTQEDLNGWEFKILRSNKIGGFKNPYDLKKALEEEAQSGWEMVEKFDDHRLRLKRKISERNKNQDSSVDPYRVVYGMSNATLTWLILGGTVGFTLFIMLIAVLAEVL